VAIAPTALAFTSAGAGAAQNVTVSQLNTVGGFTVSTCVAAGVTIATAAATTTGTLAVTPVAAGVCTFTVTGSGGLTAPLGVTVTTTGVVTN
jgi:hypothetical protein